MFPFPSWSKRPRPENLVARLANTDHFIPHSYINGGAGLLTLGQLGPGPSGIFHEQVTTNVGLAGVPTGNLVTSPLSSSLIGP